MKVLLLVAGLALVEVALIVGVGVLVANLVWRSAQKPPRGQL